MKKIYSVLIAVGALVAFASFIHAETGTVNLLASGTVTNNTTRTTGFADVKVDNNEIVSLQINAEGSQAGTGELKLTIARSKDGTTFETTPRQVIGFALNGTTPIVGFTNLTQIGGAHTLRLVSVQNADASASALNVTVSVVKKIVKTR